MKYYFPTSTLNFDAIYSSMSIMPPSFYREEAIWFSRYFKTGVDVSDEVIVLYSRPVKWEVLDEGSVDFPMLVEMDSSIVDSLLRDNDHCVRADLSQGVSCVFINIPIIFRTVDLISGKIKIIFRNQQEQKELVSRARVGVAECKFANALEDLQVDFFRDVFPDDAISFNVITADVLEEIGKSSLKFVHGDFEEYECQDRERGAEAGFMAGKWIHSVQSGYCLDCFRGGFDYDSWKKMLPPEFANIIDMLCNKIGFRWDVNRSAIVDFCAECWKRCFNVGENNLRVEQWHIILQKIAKGHKDPTFSYPVRSITDRYMQALACFIGAGKRSNILAKSIQDDKVAMPELALALHGALVGYSVFQRVFFEFRNFESQPPLPPSPPSPPSPPPPPPPPQEWARRIIDIARKVFSRLRIPHKKQSVLDGALLQSLSECANKSELMRMLPKKYKEEGWGSRTKVFKELNKAIQDGEGDLFAPSQSEEMMPVSGVIETGSGRELLIDDYNLVNGLKEFLLTQTGFEEQERAQILKDVLYLQREYASGGRYARDEKKNPRDNANTIRHLVNLINMNGPLSEAKKDSLYSFLKQRYSLEGNNG